MGNFDLQGSASPNCSAKVFKVLAELVNAHGLLEDLSKLKSPPTIICLFSISGID